MKRVALGALAISLLIGSVQPAPADAMTDRLATLGCDLFQGYHLGRPQRDKDFFAWLTRQPTRQPRLHAVPSPRDAAKAAASA